MVTSRNILSSVQRLNASSASHSAGSIMSMTLANESVYEAGIPETDDADSDEMLQVWILLLCIMVPLFVLSLVALGCVVCRLCRKQKGKEEEKEAGHSQDSSASFPHQRSSEMCPGSGGLLRGATSPSPSGSSFTPERKKVRFTVGKTGPPCPDRISVFIDPAEVEDCDRSQNPEP